MNLNRADARLQFVDFSEPPLDRLDSNVTCKFILVQHAALTIMVAGMLDMFPYHANLLAKFCDDRGIDSVWARRPDLLEVLDLDVEIAGGGYIKLTDGKVIDIFGSSTSYGRYDAGLVNRFVREHPFFASCKVSIK